MSFPDFEISEHSIKTSYERIKKIKILVIGDYETGKSSLLRSLCGKKTKKEFKNTLGCEIHSFKNKISYSYISENKDLYKEDYLIEFWELSGDRAQRSFIDVYYKSIINEIKGIIFMFELKNLKTLNSLYNWIRTIFENKSSNKTYNYLWDIPFFLIGNKKDLVNKKYLNDERKKVLSFIHGFFNCQNGENLVFLDKDFKQTDIDFKFLQMFLNHLCVENELIRKKGPEDHNSEYLEKNKERILAKNSHKYTVNNNLLINKIKLQILDKNEIKALLSYYFSVFIERLEPFSKIFIAIHKGLHKIYTLITCQRNKKESLV